MPKPVLVQNNGALDLTPEDVYELASGHSFFRTTGAAPPDLRQAWQKIGQALTIEHSRLMPGTRPHGWWVFAVTEKRLQIDNGETHSMLQIGTAMPQRFFYGAPSLHAAQDQNAIFECQCEFLARTGRLTLEEKRLVASDTVWCAACTYVENAFGQPHMSPAMVKHWMETAYRA